MPDLNIAEIIARRRTDEVLALISAAGERTDDLEDDAYRLFLALEHHRVQATPATGTTCELSCGSAVPSEPL